MPRKFSNPDVKAAFQALPLPERNHLLAVREMIFEVAKTAPRVGKLDETLKWGQPAYLTVSPKSGTTIRLGLNKSGVPAMFTHCQTSVMTDARALMPDGTGFDGNRGMFLPVEQALPSEPLALVIARALTYHLSA